jgi:cell wall-associated NlpC family hydrolase
MRGPPKVMIAVGALVYLLGANGASGELAVPAYPDYVSSASEWQEWSNKAIRWAQECEQECKEHPKDKPQYKDLCLAFVAKAFMEASKEAGRDPVAAGWGSANDAVSKLGDQLHSTQKNPPRGALAFFSGRRDANTGRDYTGLGHIGICVGDDRVIHAYRTVKENSISDIEDLPYIDSYLGWAYPPHQWFGSRGWRAYRVGSLSFSVPSDWKVVKAEADSFCAFSTENPTDKRTLSFMVGVVELPSASREAEPGKWRIVHYGFDGGRIEEPGTTSRTYSIGHTGYLVDSFRAAIAGRPVTVCVLRLGGREGMPLAGIESTNWSFALIEGGKHYAFTLIGADPSSQKAVFEQLISRMSLPPKSTPADVRPQTVPVLCGLVHWDVVDDGSKTTDVLIPLLVCDNGRYRSCKEALERASDEKTQSVDFVRPEAANEIIGEFQQGEFWLYRKGVLVGKLRPTSPWLQTRSAGWRGRISWEVPRRTPRSVEDLVIVGLSQAVDQPFWPERTLTEAQSQALRSVINTAVTTLFQRFQANPKRFTSEQPDTIELMDLEQDGQPEVYVKAERADLEDGIVVAASLLLTWRKSSWVGLLKGYSYEVLSEGEEERKREGEGDFDLYPIDIDGDGVAELLLDAPAPSGFGRECWLYRMEQGKPAKVIFLGEALLLL